MSSKNELDRKKKISKLKELTAAAGTSNLDDAASKVASDVKKGLTKAVKGIGTSALQTGGVAGAMALKDKRTEEQQSKRYNNAPASDSKLSVKDGILSKGIFSSNSKKRDEDEKKKRAAGFR